MRELSADVANGAMMLDDILVAVLASFTPAPQSLPGPDLTDPDVHQGTWP